MAGIMSCPLKFGGCRKAACVNSGMCEDKAKRDGHPLDKYNVDQMYEAYLDMVQLDKRKMPMNQQIETKRAFYGAAGFIFNAICNEAPDLPEDEAIKVVEKIRDQVLEFWKRQPGINRMKFGGN